ncbi:hypothetical protein NDK43_20545 [Neobacillus pocheonensis]|uniref:Uncharacterized protein n=1 Tax=Neobacillus pocheonensis TaxID=363869 RepID=A0ABT0WE23_9BACI|nr:hypothetical protein [Neobacillus pocheonensis]
MTQKKNELNGKEYVSTSIINTLWNQYEDAVARSSKISENQYKACIKTIEESTKFTAEWRNTLKSFYGITEKANIMQMNFHKQKITEENEKEHNHSLQNQIHDIANRWINIILTPIKSSFDNMELFEKRFVENSKIYLENLNQRRKERSAALDEFHLQLREKHEKFVFRIEDSIKVLAGSRDM